MRDTLALALFRAQLSRAYAAQRHGFPRKHAVERVPTVIGRTMRSLRLLRGGGAAADGRSRQQRAAQANASPPD